MATLKLHKSILKVSYTLNPGSIPGGDIVWK